MNIKLKKINIPRKCIFITLLVLVFIVFLINNENIKISNKSPNF